MDDYPKRTQLPPGHPGLSVGETLDGSRRALERSLRLLQATERIKPLYVRPPQNGDDS